MVDVRAYKITSAAETMLRSVRMHLRRFYGTTSSSEYEEEKKLSLPAEIVSKLPKGDGDTVYTKDYFLSMIERDDSLFNVDNWPKQQVTRETVKELWESDKWIRIDGHFSYVMPAFKVMEGTLEELQEAFEKNKAKAWKYLLEVHREQAQFHQPHVDGTRLQQEIAKLKEEHERSLKWHQENLKKEREHIALYSRLLNENSPLFLGEKRLKELNLGVDKRLLMEKHPSANILEVDVQQESRKTGSWITRTSFSLTAEQLREMLKLAETPEE